MSYNLFLIISGIFFVLSMILIKKFIPETKIAFKKVYSLFLKLFLKPSLMFLIIILILQLMNAFTTKENKTSNGGFTIENYDVLLNVNENNIVNVTENIKTDFYEDNHHGIYKFIPEWLEYTSKDGKTIKRKSIINNLKSSEQYAIGNINKKKMIRIGSPSKTISGVQDYQITYDYDMGYDPYDGYDEFIFHLYGDYWNETIKKPTVTITMPKSINLKNVHFFKDKERKIDVTDYMDFELNNNVLKAKYNTDKCEINCDLNNSLTVDIELPDGYFKNCNYNYDDSSLKVIFILFIILVIVFILWLIFGRNQKENIQTVEYYPPLNLDPAQMGYALYQSNNKKLIIALILNLTAKKYIKIIEHEGKQYIVNLCVPDENEERIFYENTLHMDLKDLNFSNIDNLKGLTVTEKIVYNNLFLNKNINDFGNSILMTSICKQVYDELNDNFKSYIISKKSIIVQIISIILYLISYSLEIYNYFLAENLNPKYNIILYLSYILIALILFLTLLMKKKTYFGEEVTAKVNGFKEYLEKVEKEKLNTLVLENPNYFQDILPYAYILNVSKKWTEKFEDIVIENKIADFHDINIDLLTSAIISIPEINDNKFLSIGKNFDPNNDDYDNLSDNGSSSSWGGNSRGCSSCGGGGSW